jgi:hypothetical protein
MRRGKERCEMMETDLRQGKGRLEMSKTQGKQLRNWMIKRDTRLQLVELYTSN